MPPPPSGPPPDWFAWKPIATAGCDADTKRFHWNGPRRRTIGRSALVPTEHTLLCVNWVGVQLDHQPPAGTGYPGNSWYPMERRGGVTCWERSNCTSHSNGVGDVD